jgi:transcriptional regulator GlxA family with amidase domain
MKKNVAILIFDDVEVLDFTGPFEVFGVTNELSKNTAFNLVTVATSRATIRAVNGLKVLADYTLEDCPAPDVLIVPGGAGTRKLLNQPTLLEWLRIKARTAEIVASVCTGALLLGKIGLLDGLRVTTHHQCLDELRAVAPAAVVDPSQRFYDNNKVCTAAGISAGIDLSLHLVSRLLSPEAANQTASHMEYERRT